MKSAIATVFGATLLGLVKTTSGSNSFIDPRKIPQELDISFTIESIPSIGFLDAIENEEDVDDLKEVLENRLESIIYYSKQWQEQTADIRGRIPQQYINNFFDNTPADPKSTTSFNDDFSSISDFTDYDFQTFVGLDQILYVFKNLITKIKFDLSVGNDFDPYVESALIMNISVRTKFLVPDAAAYFIIGLSKLLLWDASADITIKRIQYDFDRLNDDTKRLLFPQEMGGSELRKF
jgi:hypothetical protein